LFLRNLLEWVPVSSQILKHIETRYGWHAYAIEVCVFSVEDYFLVLLSDLPAAKDKILCCEMSFGVVLISNFAPALHASELLFV
jgi:hypothetical protein